MIEVEYRIISDMDCMVALIEPFDPLQFCPYDKLEVRIFGGCMTQAKMREKLEEIAQERGILLSREYEG